MASALVPALAGVTCSGHRRAGALREATAVAQRWARRQPSRTGQSTVPSTRVKPREDRRSPDGQEPQPPATLQPLPGPETPPWPRAGSSASAGAGRRWAWQGGAGRQTAAKGRAPEPRWSAEGDIHRCRGGADLIVAPGVQTTTKSRRSPLPQPPLIDLRPEARLLPRQPRERPQGIAGAPGDGHCGGWAGQHSDSLLPCPAVQAAKPRSAVSEDAEQNTIRQPAKRRFSPLGPAATAVAPAIFVALPLRFPPGTPPRPAGSSPAPGAGSSGPRWWRRGPASGPTGPRRTSGQSPAESGMRPVGRGRDVGQRRRSRLATCSARGCGQHVRGARDGPCPLVRAVRAAVSQPAGVRPRRFSGALDGIPTAFGHRAVDQDGLRPVPRTAPRTVAAPGKYSSTRGELLPGGLNGRAGGTRVSAACLRPRADTTGLGLAIERACAAGDLAGGLDHGLGVAAGGLVVTPVPRALDRHSLQGYGADTEADAGALAARIDRQDRRPDRSHGTGLDKIGVGVHPGLPAGARALRHSARGMAKGSISSSPGLGSGSRPSGLRGAGQSSPKPFKRKPGSASALALLAWQERHLGAAATLWLAPAGVMALTGSIRSSRGRKPSPP